MVLKLLNMGSKADAGTIVDHMEAQFRTDNIWTIFETRLKAITTDGANVSFLISLRLIVAKRLPI